MRQRLSPPATTPGPTSLDASAPGTASPAVSVTRLTRTFGRGNAAVRALVNATCAWFPGTWTAVMGPSGSGKTTLLNCASGLLRPTSGEVSLAGIDLVRAPASTLTRLRRESVGFVFQSYNLVPALTAAQNVELPLRLGGHRPPPSLAREALARVGLGDRHRALASQLSGGQQQRVAIARALATRPVVLFADEPTGALDTAAGQRVLDLFEDARSEGTCVVMVTHDPAVAARADRVLFLRDGQIAAETGRLPIEQIAAMLVRVERGES